MSKSIISNKRRRIICGMTYGLHKHHVFAGHGRRKISEREGCWCYLCARHHNASDAGVHFNRQFDLALKEYTQGRWEQEKGNREQFIKLFGKNYIED